MEQDVCKVNFEQLPKVDLIAAGFLCLPFSVCGKQQGFNDNRGNLFYEILRAVDEKQPEFIFLENVANLAEHDNGRTFNIIHNELIRRDYTIRYRIVDACECGIPQHRTRIYIVAFSDFNKSERFVFPEKISGKTSIWDCIDRTSRADKSLYLSPNTSDYNRMSSFIKDERQIYRFSDFGIQAGKNEISFTLKANMGTYYNRIPIIKDDFGIRKISPSECLSLQGFPTDFTFPDIPVKQAYKQAGNTVCVPVVKAIADNIIKL